MALSPRKPKIPARSIAEEPSHPAANHGLAPIEGGLISVIPEGVLGWAWNPGDPTHAPKVTLMAGDVPVGTTVADLFDHELIRARVGPGISGFIIKPVTDAPLNFLPLKLTLQDEEARILGVPLIIDDPELLSYLSTNSYEGNVDGIDRGTITGWAWSPTMPDRVVAVELYDNNDLIDQTNASLFRHDLAVAGKQYGYCAFRFDLPVWLLDAQTHTLKIKIADNKFELPGSPIAVGAQTTTQLLDELSDLRAEVKRLGEALDRVVSPHGDVQITLVRTLSERVAAFAEIQRETIERELDALRAFAFGSDSVSSRPAQSADAKPNGPDKDSLPKASKRRPRTKLSTSTQ